MAAFFPIFGAFHGEIKRGREVKQYANPTGIVDDGNQIFVVRIVKSSVSRDVGSMPLSWIDWNVCLYDNKKMKNKKKTNENGNKNEKKQRFKASNKNNNGKKSELRIVAYFSSSLEVSM